MIQASLQPGVLAPTARRAADIRIAAAEAMPAPWRSAAKPRDPAPAPRRSLGTLLLDDGAVTAGNLLKAIVTSRREHAPLAEVLLARRWVARDAL